MLCWKKAIRQPCAVNVLQLCSNNCVFTMRDWWCGSGTQRTYLYRNQGTIQSKRGLSPPSPTRTVFISKKYFLFLYELQNLIQGWRPVTQLGSMSIQYSLLPLSHLGLTGGFAKVFCGTQVYRVVNIVDKGFIRYGYDRSRRWGQSQSFLQWATQEQLTHPHFHFFLPLTATDQALDNNLQPAGLPTFGLRRRMTDLQSNSSRIVTASRHHIENSNARLWSLKLSGVSSLVPQQLLKASGTAPTPQLPIIFIWHKVMDAVYRRK